MRRIVFLVLLLAAASLRADPPANYYNSANGLSGTALKNALHDIIDGHTVISYGNLFPPLRVLHQDPANSNNVILFYSRTSVAKTSSSWNREHTWPRSRGNNDEAGPDDSDLHHVVPCDDNVNSLRGNLPYDQSDPANSGYRANATGAPLCSYDANSWEPADVEKGDLARAMFYLAVRYDGAEPNTTNFELSENPPASPGNQPLMGVLTTLLAWHNADPPDAAERARNDLIYTNYQRNRNPFIDHPEWVASIFGGSPTPTTATARVAPNDSTAVELPTMTGQFTVQLSAANAANLTVNFALSGTAQFSEYMLSGTGVTFNSANGTGTLALPANATTATIVLTAVADGVSEATETATLNLLAGTGYTVAGSAATITISDGNPPPTSKLARWNFETPANASAPLPADVRSATIDFSGYGGTLASFAGQSGQALALVSGNGNGTFIDLRCSTMGFGGLQLTFYTRFSSAAAFTMGTWSYSINGTTFTPLAGVNTAPTSANFVLKTVDFSAIPALVNAPDVTLRYTLSGATSASTNIRIDELTVLANALPVIVASASDADAAEKNADPASVVVTSSSVAPAGGLTVGFALSGTATRPGMSGADYTLSGAATYDAATGAGTVVIPANATTATVSLTPVADGLLTEGRESAFFTLTGSTAATIGTPSSASVALQDQTPYSAAWLSRYPALTGANAAPDADADGDGYTTFAECAFDLHPLSGDLANAPQAAILSLPDPASGGALRPFSTISFTRRTDAGAPSYRPQSSSDLSVWSENLVQVAVQSGANPGTERVIFRSLTPFAPPASVFLRVQVVPAS